MNVYNNPSDIYDNSDIVRLLSNDPVELLLSDLDKKKEKLTEEFISKVLQKISQLVDSMSVASSPCVNKEGSSEDRTKKILHSKSKLLKKTTLLYQSIKFFLEQQGVKDPNEKENNNLGKRVRDLQEDQKFADSYQLEPKKRRVGEFDSSKQYVKTLALQLYHTRNEAGNVSIYIGEKKEVLFKAHKLMLMESSPFFKQSFSNGMTESEEKDGAYEITLKFDHINPAIFEDILHFIYTHEMIFQSPYQAIEYLQYASLFMLEDLESSCLDYLSLNFSLLTPGELFEFFEIANQTNCVVLSNFLLKIICLNANYTILQASKIQLSRLSVESFINIIEQNFLSLNERNIAQVVYHYLKLKSRTLSETQTSEMIQRVSSLVRLSLIQRDELYENWISKKVGRFELFKKRRSIAPQAKVLKILKD